ncbi:MAG TPA: DUF4406 domain-containing protein [Clostridia bacterium]|nr:DUF4406 domain-containing protein [Clostridia bacterium]
MDYKNAEGYADPTAYEALMAVAKSEKPYKPLVYIASPYAGDTETNVRRAQGYCRFAVTKNCIPIAPHLHYPQFMDDSDKEQRELGLFFALVLLGKCDELWIFGDRVSNGMSKEIKKAEKRSIPIRRFSFKCEEVS